LGGEADKRGREGEKRRHAGVHYVKGLASASSRWKIKKGIVEGGSKKRSASFEPKEKGEGEKTLLLGGLSEGKVTSSVLSEYEIF